MKIYIHKGSGHYLGSVIVVASRNNAEAKELIRAELDLSGLKEEKVNIEETYAIGKEPWIIYSWDGDY